jgi:predicted DNA-binding transcriptional regulator AlpA
VAVDLVGIPDIASMLDVSRQRVGQLIDTYADFPEASAVVGGRRLWTRAQVERWMAKHPERQPGRPRKPNRKEKKQ